MYPKIVIFIIRLKEELILEIEVKSFDCSETSGTEDVVPPLASLLSSLSLSQGVISLTAFLNPRLKLPPIESLGECGPLPDFFSEFTTKA